MVKSGVELERYKKLLLNQKSSLEQELGVTAPVQENEENFADANDQATHDTDLSNELTVKHIKNKQYREIINALEKIKEGNYGICEDCGEQISNKRLEVYPTSKLCIVCQEEYEREQKTQNIIESLRPETGSGTGESEE
jgi:DnaK suppressor protein